MANSEIQNIDPWDGVSVQIRHADLYPCGPAWNIPLYRISHSGLFYILKGRGWLERDGERFEALPGDLFISRPGQNVAAGHDPKLPITVYSTGYWLRGPANVDALRRFDLPQRLRLPQNSRKTVERLFVELIAESRETSSPGLLGARGALLRLIAEVLRLVETLPQSAKTGSGKALPAETSRASEVIAHIDRNIAQPLTLNSLARVAHLSPVYFSKMFREQMGLSPMAYVRRRRMEMARALLSNGDDSIERVAQAVGFKDPFHFSRLFRRALGCAPSAYRSALKNPFLS